MGYSMYTIKGMTFPSPLTFNCTQVLSLTNVVTYPLHFLTAYKMMSRHSILAGMSDSKNPDLYYYKHNTEKSAENPCRNTLFLCLQLCSILPCLLRLLFL